MKFRFYFLFFFFTMLLMFYPGNPAYFDIFAFNRNLFNFTEKNIEVKLEPIPVITFNYQPQVSAGGVLVMDLPSFTPLYEFNSREKFFPASTVKIITALVAMDVYKPDDVVTVKRELTEGQLMELKTGETITVENLLYGILVHSGNDAAYALADHYGYDNFIDLMNKKAQSLGMKDSRFKNPAGLDSQDQYVTPYDLAIASRELLKDPLLKKIVGTKEIIISDTEYKIFHTLSNVNKLLGEIQGLGGLKTGYTEFAGENLVSFYKNNGHQYIIVILKSADRFEDTRSIVRWIQDNVKYITNYAQTP